MNKKTLEEEHEAALQEKERVIESLQEKLNAKEDEVRSLEEGKKTAPVVAAHDDGSATFYAPITVFAPLCLKCHGEPGSDIDEATTATLAELYPEDEATGFALGDLRGMWAIRVPAEATTDRPE